MKPTPDDARRRLSREETRELTRERLTLAAMEVFLQHGFAAASLDEIAERAGYTKGAVYANFDGKDGLFLAAFDRHYQDAAPVWAPALDPRVTGAERMDRVVRLLERATRDLQEHARSGSYTWTLLELEFALRAFRSAETRARLAEYYRRFRRMSEPLAGDATAAWLLQAAGIGISLLTCVDPDASPEGLWRRLARSLDGTVEGEGVGAARAALKAGRERARARRSRA